MRTSIGYHTFVKTRSLTQETAGRIFTDFKKYRDKTGEIQIIPKHYDNDPYGRHYSIVYPNQEKGISWRIRFSSWDHLVDCESVSCSIKATINPKVLIGEKTYIVAADESYSGAVERLFNEEAKRISPALGCFHDYSLNRIDYCINFDVSELDFDCPPSLKEELPKLIMRLIQQGEIPTHFSVEYLNEAQFYLKSKSLVVNCYWKHRELRDKFSDCRDLDAAYNIIRFEVQFRYPKVYAVSAKEKKDRQKRLESLLERMNELGYFNRWSIFVSEEERLKILNNPEVIQLERQYRKISRLYEIQIIEKMLSDETSSEVIDNYFFDIIKRGDYYTFDGAKRLIEARVSRWEKIVRLTKTLELVRDRGGITKAKEPLLGKELEDFRRSLRELAQLEINPVTIPPEWGISRIPNLLDNFYRRREEERQEAIRQEIFEDYVADCKRRGKSWISELSKWERSKKRRSK